MIRSAETKCRFEIINNITDIISIIANIYKDKYGNTNETPLKFWNTLTKKWNTLETPFRGKEKTGFNKEKSYRFWWLNKYKYYSS